MHKFLRSSLIHFLWELPLLFFLLWLISYVALRARTEILLLTEEQIPADTAYLMLVRDSTSPAEGVYEGGWKTTDGEIEGRWRTVLYAGFFQTEYRLPMLASDRYGKLSETAFPWAMILTLLSGMIALVLSIIGTVKLFRGFGSKPDHDQPSEAEEQSK